MFITMYLLVIDQNHWWQVDMTYNLDFVAITRSILFLYKNEYQYFFVNTFLKFMRVISYYLVHSMTDFNASTLFCFKLQSGIDFGIRSTILVKPGLAMITLDLQDYHKPQEAHNI